MPTPSRQAVPVTQTPHIDRSDTFLSTMAQGALDDKAFALGIVRLNPERRVVYVNRAARDMSGNEVRVDRLISELELDDESRASLTTELNRRFASGSGSSYRVRFRRTDLDTWVKVLISAVPEYDASGECVGSIGYFLDETLESARLDIHRAIASAKNASDLFDNLTRSLHKTVSFDTLMVTGINRKRDHLARVFEHPTPPIEITPTLWWPMPPFVKAMIDNCDEAPLDLERMFATPEFIEYMKSDPSIEQFRGRGFKFCLRVGVYREEQLVAMISLLRKADRPFSDSEVAYCRRLPLGEAVNAALRFQERRDLRFDLEFVKDIARTSDDYQTIGKVLVNQLAAHYCWNHVALFRLDREGEGLQLVSQAGKSAHRVPENYSQSCTTGFLGEAFRTKSAINIGYVHSPQYAGRYHALLPSTLAEMVLPIPGTDGRWILNVESELRDAFADEEQEAVCVQLQIAGFILERVASLEIKTAILKSVADAVIHTNDDDVILDANPAAEQLLGLPLEKLRHMNLVDLVALEPATLPIEHAPSLDESGARAEVTPERKAVGIALKRIVDQPDPIPVKIRSGENLIPVLMSAAPLPQRIGGRVFVASDLREQNRIQRMEVLNSVFQQLAGEIRVPLALSEAFLSDALKRKGSAARDLVEKTLKQIRKADMPLERIMRLAARDHESPLPRLNFELRDAVERLIAEFPESDAEYIRLLVEEVDIPVQAPRHELLFCVRSLLAYLMRRKAQVERVEISLERRGPKALISLEVPRPLDASNEVTSTNDIATDSELALSQPVLANLMHRMGGGYAPLAEGRRGFQLHFAAE